MAHFISNERLTRHLNKVVPGKRHPPYGKAQAPLPWEMGPGATQLREQRKGRIKMSL